MNFENSITQALVNDILKIIHKYDESIMLVTALGCLEVVKATLIAEHLEDEDDDEF